MLIHSVGQDYEEQKKLLARNLEQRNEEILAATFLARRNSQTGELASYCMWARGMKSLLPKTDLIYFFDPTRPDGQRVVASARWERAEEILGNLLEPLDIYPERHRASDFPGENQIAELKADGGLD